MSKRIMRSPHKWTKNGKRRKGKATITEARLALRETFWHTLREQIRDHLAVAGYSAAVRMARITGLSPSDIHHFTCPVCEHDREPNFSVGMAILMYLSAYKFKADAQPEPTPDAPLVPDLTDEIIEQQVTRNFSLVPKPQPLAYVCDSEGGWFKVL